ncbi:flavin-dependent monooxygenase FMO1 [Danaus plexippus plexippus]|uniref:Flavin-containing monooxygenase n=1 Tax=Danaus plexippus plexippus TaxID=278856 RepID=A0A212F1T7_DANPL|nr:flavin-dependent monooxygenase FMO1 [Danaus plexippus plexippus]
MTPINIRTCVLLTVLKIIYTNGLSLPPSHSCVIGAGYSGLAAARYLKEFGLKFTVFEASRDVGGTWRFDPNVGLDADGIPVTTSQYKYLRTNTPRQTMEFNGYPFPNATPTFPTGTCFYKYIKSFVKKFDLKNNIQLRSLVTSVSRVKYHWDLVYFNTEDRQEYGVDCDFVIIANGQYVRPVVPNFIGLEAFEGTVMHSHDYKGPEAFEGRKVLLVGAGASGLDLAVQLNNITAKLVHSHHLKYNQPKFSDKYVKKPDIKVFVKNGVIFEDGSFEEVEHVILATGYEFDQPFLDETSGLTRTGKFVLPLYRNIINIAHPSMMFLGVVNGVITRTMDVQAEYIASLIAGKFKLPSQDEMLESWLKHVHSLKYNSNKILYVNTIGKEMDNYFGNLTEEAGVTRVLPVLSDIRDFNAENRLEDLLNYRDYDFEIIDANNYKRWYNGGGGRAEECFIEE